MHAHMQTGSLPGISPAPPRPLYVFVDESGNFDFSPSGTPYLVLTAVSCQRPFWWYPDAAVLRYDLLETAQAPDVEYFHASEDRVPVRNAMFDLISSHAASIRVDSVVVEKRKAHPSVRGDRSFYPAHLTTLVRYVITGWGFHAVFPETLVFTDTIPHARKRKAIEGAVKATLKASLGGAAFRLFHHASRAHIGLQVADYCCWGIYRKWARGEPTYYRRIQTAVRSEFDVYKQGQQYFY